MTYGSTLRWYVFLFFVASALIYAFARFGLNIAPEVGACMIAIAIFFGAKKISFSSALGQTQSDSFDLVKQKRLVLDAGFAIAGTLINGFSKLIFYVLS